MCAVQTFAVPIIQATGCAAEMVGPAATYMRIRALSMPATLVLMMAQVCEPIPGTLPACNIRLPELSVCSVLERPFCAIQLRQLANLPGHHRSEPLVT